MGLSCSATVNLMSSSSPPPLPHFPDIGCEVEITTKDEGFDGVIFPATVLSGLREDGDKQTLQVQYHTLVASEKGKAPLMEDIDICYIRPQPPVEEQAVVEWSPGDLVDAYNQDGWWTGVVTGRVVGPGKRRYLVRFEDHFGGEPVPFVVPKIRIHWDWELANQLWSRPAKKAELESLSKVGGKIEVSHDGRKPHGSWFEASILECFSDGSVLVEYSALKDSDGQLLKATVPPLHVRPCPPRINIETLLNNDEIEVYYEFGWWTGVIMEVLEGGRYAVSFMQRERNQEFCDSDIRPHLYWKDGTWLTYLMNVTLPEAQVPNFKRKRTRPPMNQQPDDIPHQKSTTEVPPRTQLSSSKRRGRKRRQVEESTTAPDPRSTTLNSLEVENQVPELQTNEIYEQPIPESIEGHVPQATQSTENGQGTTKKSCIAVENGKPMDVLEWIQQQPQFPNLELGKKIPRETAENIGLKVCFRGLIQTILDNPKAIKPDVLDGLQQYERTGIDISVLQDSIIKLLEVRSSQVNVDDEAKSIDHLISVQSDEKCRIDNEISETDKEIEKLQEQMDMLQEKLSRAKLAKENKDGEISALQVKLQEVNESIEDMDMEMHGVAASLWNHYFP